MPVVILHTVAKKEVGMDNGFEHEKKRDASKLKYSIHWG
jgi:hypothetical protein